MGCVSRFESFLSPRLVNYIATYFNKIVCQKKLFFSYLVCNDINSVEAVYASRAQLLAWTDGNCFSSLFFLFLYKKKNLVLIFSHMRAHAHTHAQLLIDLNYSVTQADQEGQKPLDWADHMNQTVCVRYLMMYEACWALSAEVTHLTEQLAM